MKLFSIQNLALSFLLTTLTFYSCKKNENPPTNNNTNSIADEYVGIWNAKDTTYFFNGSTSTKTFNFSIAKRDSNSIYLINFNGISDTATFLVSATALVYTSGGSGSDVNYLEDFVMTRNGNKIYYTGPGGGSGSTNSGTATKL